MEGRSLARGVAAAAPAMRVPACQTTKAVAAATTTGADGMVAISQEAGEAVAVTGGSPLEMVEWMVAISQDVGEAVAVERGSPLAMEVERMVAI